MLKVIIFAGLALAVWAATTVPPTTTTVLYDMKHHKAMIVNDKGCFEYPMDHQDILDVGASDTLKAQFESRIIRELEMAANCEMTGHHHGDHFTQEIQTACASLPYYQFADVDNSTGTNCP